MVTGFNFVLDDDNNVVPVDSVEQWGEWFEQASISKRRIVAQDDLDEYGLHVSTVFTGIDGLSLSAMGEREPMVFETMIFFDLQDIYMDRYPSWKDAERGHYQAREWAKPMKHPSTIYADNSWQHPHYLGADDHIFVIIHVAEDLFWSMAQTKWLQHWQQTRTYTQEEAKEWADHKPADGRWYAIGQRIYL